MKIKMFFLLVLLQFISWGQNQEFNGEYKNTFIIVEGDGIINTGPIKSKYWIEINNENCIVYDSKSKKTIVYQFNLGDSVKGDWKIRTTISVTDPQKGEYVLVQKMVDEFTKRVATSSYILVSQSIN